MPKRRRQILIVRIVKKDKNRLIISVRFNVQKKVWTSWYLMWTLMGIRTDKEREDPFLCRTAWV